MPAEDGGRRSLGLLRSMSRIEAASAAAVTTVADVEKEVVAVGGGRCGSSTDSHLRPDRPVVPLLLLVLLCPPSLSSDISSMTLNGLLNFL